MAAAEAFDGVAAPGGAEQDGEQLSAAEKKGIATKESKRKEREIDEAAYKAKRANQERTRP